MTAEPAKELSGPSQETSQDGLDTFFGETHCDFHVGARRLPAAHLADAELGVAQLGADLQAAALAAARPVGVVMHADLARGGAWCGRAWRAQAAAARRGRRNAARPAVVVLIPAPAATPG